MRPSRRALTHSTREAAIWSGSGAVSAATSACSWAVVSSSSVPSTGAPVPSQVAEPCWAAIRHSLFHPVGSPRAFQVP